MGSRHPSASALCAALALLGLAAAACAPYDRFFLPNFAWYWIPPALVLAVVAAVGAKPASMSEVG